MTTLLAPSPEIPTVADLLQRLGGVPAHRVRFYPAPGSATEGDVTEVEAHEDRLCELIDGVLVDWAYDFRNSCLAALIATTLSTFTRPRRLGVITGAGGAMRILPGIVRRPSVAFTSWSRLPGGIPSEPIPSLVPDLAVEVLSESNTKAEMERKRQDYFTAGVRLVWMVDPETRTVAVFTGPQMFRTLTRNDELDGGEVLPGFSLDLRELFARFPG